jgi:signal transduction histidine kinase/CheY-like chemotaxis protein
MIAAERAPQLFSRSAVMKANFPGRGARYYEIKSSRVQIGRNDASGSILTLRDVTDRVLWERELELARLELIEANQIKTQFIANINHEIRTPMNAILGVAQLLEETPLSEDQRRMVTLFRNAGGVLLSMMNDLLEYSRNESGGVKAERVPFLLREKTAEIWKPVMTLGEERGLTMRLELDPDLPEAVLGDPARLMQVLRIFLSNAIKFTEGGEVALCVRRPAPLESPDLVEFAVKDTGIGMSQAITARLFKPFNQAEDSLRRKFGGAGLGLAIANQLASLLGAQVEVRSAPGEGSEFTLTLALPAAPGGLVFSLTGRSERSLAGKRILAVDDASDNLFLIDRFLRDSGAQLALCQSPREALELFRRSLYDIALVDIQMPEVDGYELIEKLRAIERGRSENPPAAIIALTAFALPEDRARALESGFDEHLSKPVRKDQLLDTMYQAWLRKTRAGRTP